MCVCVCACMHTHTQEREREGLSFLHVCLHIGYHICSELQLIFIILLNYNVDFPLLYMLLVISVFCSYICSIWEIFII